MEINQTFTIIYTITISIRIFLIVLKNNKLIKMNKGKVKFYNSTKGFGFIKDNESDNEYFVHATGLLEDIRENDEVIFELTNGKKGLNAINVKLV